MRRISVHELKEFHPGTGREQGQALAAYAWDAGCCHRSGVEFAVVADG
nr:hypothetical protein [Comamonas jiangduensis]